MRLQQTTILQAAEVCRRLADHEAQRR